MQNKSSDNPLLLAFVGMPGSGKSEAATYLKNKGMSYIRFGDVTEEGLREANLPLTPENEKEYREKIREELGMAAYAIKSEEKIRHLVAEHKGNVVIDGLYSWEEYLYLIERFVGLKIVYVFASPAIRYERLAQRTTRPLTNDEARRRDIAEIEKLNKSGPIAIADYIIDNSGTLDALHKHIDMILEESKKTL